MPVSAILFARLASREVVDGALEGRGRVVSSTPERTIAVLASAADAFAVALRLQQTARFAIGIEVGEPIEESGGELFGLCVWVAARFAGVAEPGQTIVSDAARAIAGPELVGASPLGALTLKGIPRPVSAHLLTELRAPPSPHRIVVMLAADQVGSTRQLSALGDVRAGRVHIALLDIAREAGDEAAGTELEYTGDGLVFSFASATAALRAAVAMQAGAARWAAGEHDGSVQLRVGLAVADSEPTAREEALRTCATAAAGQVQLTATLASVVAPGGTETRPSRTEGLVEMIWSADPVVAPLAQIGPTSHPLAGRDHEMSLLSARWASAVAGARCAVVVTGPAGVGTTTLLQEFIRTTAADPAAVVMFASAAGLPGLMSLGTALGPYAATAPRAELREQVGELAPILAQVVPCLVTRLGAEPVDASPVLVAQSLEVALARITVDQPTLLVLDDLHEASEELLRALRLIASGGAASRLMVVGGARTSDIGESRVTRALGVDPHRSGAGFEELELRGLPSPAVVALLTEVMGEAPDEAQARSVIGETEGIPSLVLAYATNLAGRRATGRIDSAARDGMAARADLGRLREEIVSDLRIVRQDPAGQTAMSAAASLDPVGTPPAVVGCPYKGLDAFGIEDAEFFAGRDELVAHLLARLITTRLVAVVGASGSGKSSVVRAGLLPALTRELSNERLWTSAVLVPGAQPRRALAQALASGRSDPGKRRLVVVDQFEEIFSTSVAEPERVGFIDDVLALGGDAHSDTWVVLALRADFYDSCAAYPKLASWLTDSQVLVGAMSEAELREAIERPAKRAGLLVEPALVDAIVYDVSGEEGALPLVSTALLETWHRRQGRTMTLRGYADAGGVRGAVARLAEDSYLGLSEDRRPIVRAVFMRLAELSNHGQEVRRRAERSEFDTGDPRVRETVDYLVAGRLLTASDTSVEVAHEALLREWPRLREWLTAARQRRRDIQQLATAATTWSVSGHDPELLARGTRLAVAGELATAPDASLSELERDYLAASAAQRDAEIVAVRRTNRRLRRQLVVAVVFVVLAVVAGIVALSQRSDARHQTQAAERQTVLADARGVAAQADALQRTQPGLSLLLAVEANRLDDTQETRGGLLTVLSDSPHLDRIWQGFGKSASLVVLSPDGRVAAVTTGDSFRLWNFATEKPLGPSIPVKHLLDGQWISSGVLSTVSSNGVVQLWNGRTGRPISRKFRGVPTGACFNVACGFSANGRFFFVDGNHQIRIWRSSGGEPIHSFANQLGTTYLLGGAVSPSGNQFASVGNQQSDNSGSLRLFNTTTGRLTSRPLRIPGGSSSVVQYSPNGKVLAVGVERSAQVDLVDSRTGRTVGEPLLGHTSSVTALAFSSDGRYLASAGLDSTIIVWRTRDGSVVGQPFTGNSTAAVTELTWLPDDRHFVSASTDEVINWGLSDRTALPGTSANSAIANQGTEDSARHLFFFVRFGPHLSAWNSRTLKQLPGSSRLAPVVSGVAVNAAGDMLAATLNSGVNDNDKLGIDLLTAAPHPVLLQHLNVSGNPPNTGGTEDAAFSPSGRQLAAITDGGELDVFNIGHHSELAYREAIDPRGGLAVAWTNDGSRVVVAGQARLVEVDDRTHRIVSSSTIGDSSDYITSVSVEPGHAGIIATLSSGEVVFYSDDGARTGRADLDATNEIFWSALSPNGQLLVAGGTGGTIELWSLPSGKPLGQALPVSNGSTFPVFLDNQRLLVIGDDDTLNLVDTSPPTMTANACSIAGRNLTHQEFDDYLPFEKYHRTCSQWPAASS
jgi:WD40 repeat protein/class 3 adenylate cyclase